MFVTCFYDHNKPFPAKKLERCSTSSLRGDSSGLAPVTDAKRACLRSHHKYQCWLIVVCSLSPTNCHHTLTSGPRPPQSSPRAMFRRSRHSIRHLYFRCAARRRTSRPPGSRARGSGKCTKKSKESSISGAYKDNL